MGVTGDARTVIMGMSPQLTEKRKIVMIVIEAGYCAGKNKRGEEG
jgi:hypothetical protein